MKKVKSKRELTLEEIVERKQKEKYSKKNYKPNKNCVPVTYNGKEYKSKAQCMALEKISRKELDEYLKSQNA